VTAPATAAPTIVRVGVLMPSGSHSETGLREGLSELGYIEGKNLSIESRPYAQSTEALQSAAADLVRSGVDVIVAVGTQAAHAALSATSTIPVVFLSGDPVASGLAASLARPGANATGVSTQTTELMAKRLELFRQIVPRIRRATLLVNPDNPLHAAILSETQKVARTLRIQIVPLNARNADELDTALRGLRRNGADAFIVTGDSASMLAEACGTGRRVWFVDLPVRRTVRSRAKDLLRRVVLAPADRANAAGGAGGGSIARWLAEISQRPGFQKFIAPPMS
jgi:putative ABC transport system substrate-binding protein